MHTKFLSEKLKGRDHFGSLCTERWTKFTIYLKKTKCEGLNLFPLAQERAQCLAFVNLDGDKPLGFIKVGKLLD
jgi:hypothetical protein